MRPFLRKLRQAATGRQHHADCPATDFARAITPSMYEPSRDLSVRYAAAAYRQADGSITVQGCAVGGAVAREPRRR